MRPRLGLSLRSKFILIVLGGAVLPLALLGVWLNQTAERSGERLLRERLDTSLAEIAEDVGLRWLMVRGEILRIAELPEVHQGLREDRASGAVLSPYEADLPFQEDPPSGSPPQALEHLFAEFEGSAEAIRVLDREGAIRWGYPVEGEPTGGRSPGGARPLPVRLGIFDLASGDRLGTLEVDLPLRTLLAGSATWGGVAGSVLGASEPETGASLLPLSIDPFLLREDQFHWREETWLSVNRSLEEPPLDLVLAAPVTPFVAPFQESARRNLWILGGVTLIVLALAAALTQGTTRALSRLADAAEAVARGDLDRQVDSKGRDEVSRVGRAFNTMTESLRNTLQELSQRRALAAVGEFAASLAHEVRNPLERTNSTRSSSGSGALRSQTNTPDGDPSRSRPIRISPDRSPCVFAFAASSLSNRRFAMTAPKLSGSLAACIGMDWADGHHDLSIQAVGSNTVERRRIVHTPEALAEFLGELRRRFGGRPVGICLELSRGPLIHALLEHDFIVLFPVNPLSLSQFRAAFATSGAKDDPTDADLLLELLVKHRDRLRVWTPGDSKTRALARLVEARRKAVDMRTRLTQQLTAELKGYFPQALQWTGKSLTTQMASDFLLRWSTLKALQRARPKTIRKFYYGHNCRRGDLIEKRLDEIRTATPLTSDPAIVETSVLTVQMLAHQIRALIPSIARYEAEIDKLLAAHPDAGGAHLHPRGPAAHGGEAPPGRGDT
jgi:HAMP domain-containing protein/transposase